MASFSAELHVAGKVFTVLLSVYGFYQSLDRRGRPNRKVRYHRITLEILLTEPQAELLDWAADPYKILDGKLVFRTAAATSVAWHVWFREAFCTGYHLVFNSRGVSEEASLRAFVTISPGKMGREGGTGEAFVPAPPRSYAPPAPVPAVAAPAPGAPGSPQHKAARWAAYQSKKGNDPSAWSYARWEKQYDINMRNQSVGSLREAEYRRAMNGVDKTVKTRYTLRQIDIFIAKPRYFGQLKTGKVSLTKQAIIDLQKDRWLARKLGPVEYILEKGAPKPFLDACAKAGVLVKIGPQIP